MIDKSRALRSVGPGWSNLINELYDKLPENCVVVQVKEKFGGLRFYVDNSTKEFNMSIDDAEQKSFNICEECGTEINVETLTTNSGWLKTLCSHCRLIRK